MKLDPDEGETRQKTEILSAFKWYKDQHLERVQSLPSSWIPTSASGGRLFSSFVCYRKLHCDCTAKNVNIRLCANLPPNIGRWRTLYYCDGPNAPIFAI